MDRMKKVLFLHYVLCKKRGRFSAISNHDESTGGALDPISAALIIADKTDVRRDRAYVKNKRRKENHIHKSSDRYQYLLHV